MLFKLELIDIFETIHQLADDCIFEVDREHEDDDIENIIKRIEIKMDRISDELEDAKFIISQIKGRNKQ